VYGTIYFNMCDATEPIAITEMNVERPRTTEEIQESLQRLRPTYDLAWAQRDSDQPTVSIPQVMTAEGTQVKLAIHEMTGGGAYIIGLYTDDKNAENELRAIGAVAVIDDEDELVCDEGTVINSAVVRADIAGKKDLLLAQLAKQLGADTAIRVDPFQQKKGLGVILTDYAMLTAQKLDKKRILYRSNNYAMQKLLRKSGYENNGKKISMNTSDEIEVSVIR
jgi:ribosomal protein S18 acetylase RimI-like enzyme